MTTAVAHEMVLHLKPWKCNRSHTCRFAPPKAMKMQPRILPLRCAQRQDDSAKGEGDAAYFHGRCFAALSMMVLRDVEAGESLRIRKFQVCPSRTWKSAR